jgi:hypothetical protein
VNFPDVFARMADYNLCRFVFFGRSRLCSRRPRILLGRQKRTAEKVKIFDGSINSPKEIFFISNLTKQILPVSSSC